MASYNIDFPRVAFAPGLEATQAPGSNPPTYVMVTAGSKKVHDDDSEGWTTVKKGGRRNKPRYARQTEYYMY